METHENKDLVVLMHGILRSKYDMIPMEKFLEHKGYNTLNIGYPSRSKSLEDLTEFVQDKIKNCPKYTPNTRIHFVTHSMGSLIARYYIETHRPKVLGSVVMLGPPNTGSELADWLSDTKAIAPLFRTIYGPAGSQLRTDHQHIDQKIDYPLGVIAGNISINPLSPWVLPGRSDGIVPIERTKIEGMKEHIVIPSTHTFMMFNPKVMEKVYSFIHKGTFEDTAQ